MEAIIYFDIMTNDGYEIGVVVTAMLSGKYIPADFNHDIEDDRECLVSNIQFFNEEGEQFSGSEKLNEIVFEHIDDNDMKIYKDAENGSDVIYIDDFKSDHNLITFLS
jgi:hypothetical protein